MDPASDRGRLIRFDVQVEKNLAIDSDAAARLIAKVLNDRRSWRGTGRWRFQLVSSASEATLHAYIVTPGTTDRLCAPLLTRGEVSCQNGNRVVLNAKRWMLGADSYGSDVAGYRRYLVNHEFGHSLGYQHVGCPSRGKRAPVMMQQTKGLGGCRKNPWPLSGSDCGMPADSAADRLRLRLMPLAEARELIQARPSAVTSGRWHPEYPQAETLEALSMLFAGYEASGEDLDQRAGLVDSSTRRR